MNKSPETLVLEVLRVVSQDVLGETKPLSVATACQFSNTPGHLKSINSLEDVRRTAAATAKNFRQSVLADY